MAAWYVPLTLYRLLTAGCACIITEDYARAMELWKTAALPVEKPFTA